MLKQSSNHIQTKLKIALQTVGDMALKRRARNIIEGLELKQEDKVLEIGCGNGYYLSLLNRLDMKLKLVGIDNDRLALKDAKKFIGDERIKLKLCDASKLPFESSSFDKIVMSEVIEHVKNEEECLGEVYRVLKPDGVLALTTCDIDYPFFWDPINWILQHFFNTHIKAGFWAGVWNQHSRMYTEEQVKRLLKEAGFKVEQIRALTGWCLPFNHYIVNFIAKLFYSKKLPQSISKGLNKFENNKQPLFLKAGFTLMNLYDSLNDIIPQKRGVSIFTKAVK